MKVVNLSGGLGNQMFQCAFAYTLSKKFPSDEVLLDIQHFNGYTWHNGFEVASVFEGIPFRVASKSEIRKVTYYIPNYRLSRLARKVLPKRRSEYVEISNYVYDPHVYELSGSTYYEGFWQACQYYLPFRQHLLSLFSFSSPGGRNLEMATKIDSTDSVGIHVRRGNYLQFEEYKGICDVDYYKKGLDAIDCHGKTFFIFSNDMEWCRENISPLVNGKDIIYVDINDSANGQWDMYLMSHCRNLIIANSSFSWWAAFLNENALNVVAPSRWINADKRFDIQCPGWIKI